MSNHKDTSKDFFTRYSLAAVETERLNREVVRLKEEAIEQDRLLSLQTNRLLETQAVLREFVDAKWPSGIVSHDQYGHPLDAEGLTRQKARTLLGMDSPQTAIRSPEFLVKRPTGNFRWFTPNKELVPEVLQQEFYCEDESGKGNLWLDPLPCYRTPAKLGGSDNAP